MKARLLFIAASLIILSGCASQSFVVPAPEKLTLGKSTGEDIIQSVGKPRAQADSQAHGEKIKSITYFYVNRNAWLGRILEQRSLVYTTFNDTMVGEEYNSTIEGESTEFDTEKVPLIKNGVSTRADVIALMGNPSGQILYPLVADKKGSGLIYAYTWSRFVGIFTSQNTNLLIVTLNENNVVSNISFKKNGTEQVKQ